LEWGKRILRSGGGDGGKSGQLADFRGEQGKMKPVAAGLKGSALVVRSSLCTETRGTERPSYIGRPGAAKDYTGVFEALRKLEFLWQRSFSAMMSVEL